MKPTYLIAAMLSYSIMYSCQNIELVEINKPRIQSLDSPILRNGRLHFQDKYQLARYLDYLKKEDDRPARELGKFYDQNFLSYRPIVAIDDEIRINMVSSRLRSEISEEQTHDISSRSNLEEDYLEQKEEIIGDDEYAGVINFDGEIHIGDSIFKYTNSGLYFVNENDIEYLNEYLKEFELEKDTTYANGRSLDVNRVPRGITSLNKRISRFISPNVSSTRNIASGTQSFSQTRSEGSLEDYLDDLAPCSPQKGLWAWLFGSSRYCNSYFDSRERVKTKFWNQNYLIFKSVGMVVKRQKRRLWLWWSTKAPEIQMGINNVYLEYDIPIIQNIGGALPEYIVYNDRIYNGHGDIIKSNYGNAIPDIPFGAPIEIVVNLPYYGYYENNFSSEELNKLFWGQIYSSVKSIFEKQISKDIPEELVFIGLMQSKMFISYKGQVDVHKNKGKAKRVIDWQMQMGVKLGVNGNNSKATFKLNDITVPKFYKYKNIEIDIYGVARSGSSFWRGSRFEWRE